MIAPMIMTASHSLVTDLPRMSTHTACFVHGADMPTRFSPAAMKVVTVESTPNPSAFLLKLDAPLEGIASNGLRGKTFRKGRCPPSLTAALATEGVASIFAVQELLTISKEAAASWESVLPPVVDALGGASDALAASGSLLPSSPVGAAAPAVTGGVEAAGWSGNWPPVRAKLSARFGSAMALLIDQSGDAFFRGRAWLPRGPRATR
mmetsp:Transcript_49017/g.158386  ORF Transcript_49017/g.158386 Transcript_49017/m.158386 type:complete len:207 (-) Transcript_49017:7-627(-)